MQFPDIDIHLIAEMKLDREAVREWLTKIGVSEGGIDTLFETPEGMNDGELLSGLAAKRCYKSYEPGLNPNVSKVRKDWQVYFDNVQKSGHGSVIEHMNYTFAFENVTRVFTAEMNRHRAGVAVSEQSLRYVRFNDIPFWLPPSLRYDPGKLYKDQVRGQEVTVTDDPLTNKQYVTQEIIRRILKEVEAGYDDLVRVWDFDNMPDFHMKKEVTSMLRRIVPLGVCTGAVYTLNGRAIRHVITQRASPEAEEEICHVFSRVGKIMVERAPMLMADFEQVDGGYWVPKYRKV